MTGDMTQRVAVYWMLGLRCGHCMSYINNQMLDSVCSCLMFQVFKAANCSVSSLFHVKEVLCFFPCIWIEMYKHMKNKCGKIWYLLDRPPHSTLHLCFFSFASIFLLSNISNRFAPDLECSNPIETGPRHNVTEIEVLA